MNQYWKAAAPEPVCGQRQCRVGRIVGNQRSDTPDQSAARSTTLGHLLSKGVTKGKGAEGEQRSKVKGGGEGGAGNPGPVYGQKDQAQHPRGTKSRERAGRRGREKAEQRQNRNKQGKRRSRGQRHGKKRTHHPPECTGRREKRGVKKGQSQSGHALSKDQRMAKGE